MYAREDVPTKSDNLMGATGSAPLGNLDNGFLRKLRTRDTTGT